MTPRPSRSSTRCGRSSTKRRKPSPRCRASGGRQYQPVAWLVRPGGAGRAVGVPDVPQAPCDLRGRAGLPVGSGAGHPGAGQRLRDPEGTRPGLAAVTLHRLSCSHSGSRQENWLDDQPNEPSVACAIRRGEPDAAGTALLAASSAARFLAASSAARFMTASSAARFLAACHCAMACAGLGQAELERMLRQGGVALLVAGLWPPAGPADPRRPAVAGRPPRGLSRWARQNRRRVPGFPGTRLPPSPRRRSRRTGRPPRR